MPTEMRTRINTPGSPSKDDKSAGRRSHLPTLTKKPNMEMYFLDADAPSKSPHKHNLKKTPFVPCFLHLHTDNLQNVSAKTEDILQYLVKMQGCTNFHPLLDLQKKLEKNSKYRLWSSSTRSGKKHHIKKKAKNKLDIFAHSLI